MSRSPVMRSDDGLVPMPRIGPGLVGLVRTICGHHEWLHDLGGRRTQVAICMRHMRAEPVIKVWVMDPEDRWRP